MPGALEGTRVLEFASYVAGPYAGMMLADLGAEVIKIEQPGGGDPFRDWGEGKYSPTFEALNRNKKSITVDLKTAGGMAQVRALLKTTDVLIENFRPGVMDRMGLSYDTLSAEDAALIYCSITGFGATGPYADRPGYDTVGQGMGGLLSLMTDLHDPKPVGYSFSDHSAGLAACQGILAALFARERTGKGQHVETSLLEATVSMTGENAARYFYDGKVPDRAERTRLAQVFAFLDRDQKALVVHLSSPTKFWEGLLRAIDRNDLAKDPRFAVRIDRMKNYDALHAELAVTFQTRTRDDWLERLKENDVPAGPLNTLADVFDDPQVGHLNLKQTFPHPTEGEVSLVRGGYRLSGTPLTIRAPAPTLGQHNHELRDPAPPRTGED
jgi:formyl-CoA transferase